jgi:hypothetical protein
MLIIGGSLSVLTCISEYNYEYLVNMHSYLFLVNSNDLVVSEPIDRIKDGDFIQLVHGMSGRALNSHDGMHSKNINIFYNPTE